MPSKKPVLQIVLEENDFYKIKKIADSEGRSASNLGKRIIEKYLQEENQIKQEVNNSGIMNIGIQNNQK